MSVILTPWSPDSSGVANSNNYNIVRTTQDGKVRVTQSSLVRTLDPVAIDFKVPTVWTNA